MGALSYLCRMFTRLLVLSTSEINNQRIHALMASQLRIPLDPGGIEVWLGGIKAATAVTPAIKFGTKDEQDTNSKDVPLWFVICQHVSAGPFGPETCDIMVKVASFERPEVPEVGGCPVRFEELTINTDSRSRGGFSRSFSASKVLLGADALPPSQRPRPATPPSPPAPSGESRAA